jgi:deoxyguanosine kinase
MLISIEGNIGSGKSTVIEWLKTQENKNIVFVDEPVNEWLSIKDKDGMNALDCFYKDQKQNAFCFQILAYITRLKKLILKLEEYANQDIIIITERSIDTDRNVFAKMLYEDGLISSIEWETYNYWFDTFQHISTVNTIIYIKTDPEKCIERINIRNRTEETNIGLEYLEKCHKYHNDWLNKNDATIITINGHETVEEIRNQVMNVLNKL